jgi:hypothetical protein
MRTNLSKKDVADLEVEVLNHCGKRLLETHGRVAAFGRLVGPEGRRTNVLGVVFESGKGLMFTAEELMKLDYSGHEIGERARHYNAALWQQAADNAARGDFLTGRNEHSFFMS